jgi:hypothetical protein
VGKKKKMGKGPQAAYKLPTGMSGFFWRADHTATNKKFSINQSITDEILSFIFQLRPCQNASFGF